MPQTSNSFKPTHKHVALSLVVVGLVCIWAFVIYPKMALGLNAPGNLRAHEGDSEVVLSWTAPQEEGKEVDLAVVTQYKVYYSQGGGKNALSVETGSTETAFTVSGLTNGVEYTFAVSALSGETEGSQSEPVLATPNGIVGGGGGELDPVPISISEEPQVITTQTTAIVSWATTIEGTSVVYYGPREDFSGNTPNEEGAQKTTDHSVEITDLTPCAAYWFKVVSYDNDSNSTESQGGEFKTAGCKGSSEILTYESGKVTADMGATVEVRNSGRSIEINAPANLKSGIDAVAVEALKLEKELVQSEISTPPSKQWIGNAYSLKVFQDERTELAGTFDVPVEVTISYTAQDVVGIDPASLRIYHYEDGSGWRVLSNCENDSATMTVSCQTTSFSIFGLFGSAPSSSSVSGSAAKSTTTNQVTVTTEPVQTNTTPSPTPDTNDKTFPKNLTKGDTDPNVKKLQIFLNNAGFTVAPSGPGSKGNETDFFGPLTFAALVKFQEAHKNEILVPVGLNTGTGYFGLQTRQFINALQ